MVKGILFLQESANGKEVRWCIVLPKTDWIAMHITYKYNIGGVQMYIQLVKVAPTDIFKRFRGLRFCATYGQYT